jgi:hypothetical protein
MPLISRWKMRAVPRSFLPYINDSSFRSVISLSMKFVRATETCFGCATPAVASSSTILSWDAQELNAKQQEAGMEAQFETAPIEFLANYEWIRSQA